MPSKSINPPSINSVPVLKKSAQEWAPLITIITATFNAAKELPRTIESIRGQTYKNIEWIVVDGGSTDETIGLIQQNEDVVDYWVSEPDDGIYDAWNKGVSKASGEWIAFLGAGDSYKPESIQLYVNAIAATSRIQELVCSQVNLVNSGGMILRTIGAPFDWNKFHKYMTFAHVGALHHRVLFERYGLFDTSYRSSADYEFFMRTGGDVKSLYLDVVTSDMLIGGVSSSYQGIIETYVIQKKYGASVAALLRLWLAYTKRFIRPLFRGY